MVRIPMVSKRQIVSSLLMIGAFVMALTVPNVSWSQDTAKRGRKYKSPPPTAHFEVTVTRATNGKPIENASVIFHPLQDGHNDGNMELKTNDEGKAVLDLLEVGSDVRLQIIAPGFQTYGEDFKVDKDNLAVQVKLKRPTDQYSVYKKSEGKAGADSKDSTKPQDSAKPQDAQKPQDAPKAPGSDGAVEPQKTSPEGSAADTDRDAPKDEAKPQPAAPPSATPPSN